MHSIVNMEYWLHKIESDYNNFSSLTPVIMSINSILRDKITHRGTQY